MCEMIRFSLAPLSNYLTSKRSWCVWIWRHNDGCSVILAAKSSKEHQVAAHSLCQPILGRSILVAYMLGIYKLRDAVWANII